jgi:hypothetical protein
MDVISEADLAKALAHNYRAALLALGTLPDQCAVDVTELAARLGADKLELVTWARADIKFARLLAAKLATS